MSKCPGKLLQFYNCRILRKSAIIKEDLWVREGKIIDPKKIFFDEKKQADERIDCKNSIISPGFIELQINGKKFKYIDLLNLITIVIWIEITFFGSS